MLEDRTNSLHTRRIDEDGSLDETLTIYKQALEKLRSFGVKIPDQSRLISYQRGFEEVLRQQGDLLFSSEEDAARILFDFREMDELINIVESFGGEPSSSELQRLRLLPEGTDYPDHGTSTRARDAQYELFLRAMYSRSGLDIQMGSPDLLLSDGRIIIPIEAKRPNSPSRLDDRLREAVHQIENQERFGVIAISLDQVIRPRGGFLVVEDQSKLASAVGGLVRAYMLENTRGIAGRVRDKPKVTAILFTFRTPARAANTNLTLLGSNIVVAPLSEPGLQNYECLEAFQGIMDRVRI